MTLSKKVGSGESGLTAFCLESFQFVLLVVAFRHHVSIGKYIEVYCSTIKCSICSLLVHTHLILLFACITCIGVVITSEYQSSGIGIVFQPGVIYFQATITAVLMDAYSNFWYGTVHGIKVALCSFGIAHYCNICFP